LKKYDDVFNYPTSEDACGSGESRLSNLFHEGRHGGQVTEGKLGFIKIGDFSMGNDYGSDYGEWRIANYDISDERDALKSQLINSTGGTYTNEYGATKYKFSVILKSLNDQELDYMLKDMERYKHLKDGPFDNQNRTKIKNSYFLMYPSKK
jgi:hypothetical protein